MRAVKEAEVQAILKRRRDWALPDARYVFPRPAGPRKPVRSDLVQRALAENRSVLGLSPEFTSHNARHMFTTWAAEQGHPVEVVNRCTAHVVATGINARYNFARLDKPAGELWAAWAEWLAS